MLHNNWGPHWETSQTINPIWQHRHHPFLEGSNRQFNPRGQEDNHQQYLREGQKYRLIHLNMPNHPERHTHPHLHLPHPFTYLGEDQHLIPREWHPVNLHLAFHHLGKHPSRLLQNNPHDQRLIMFYRNGTQGEERRDNPLT